MVPSKGSSQRQLFILCVVYMHTPVQVPVRVSVKRPEDDIRCPVPSLTVLRQDLSMNLELGWQPVNPAPESASISHSVRITGLAFLR